MRKKILVILGFAVLILALPQIKAEDTTVEDTTIDIIVISEGNVTGYINCTAINGSVSYYIDGIEVKGEFDKVWSSISGVRKTAQRARSLAGSAYRYADNNHNDIVELSIISENNTNKIYILRDELVSFENEYIVFKNNTNTTFTQITYKIKNLREDVTSLQEADKELEKNIRMLWISIMGLLVCFGLMIWVFNKKSNPERISEMESRRDRGCGVTPSAMEFQHHHTKRFKTCVLNLITWVFHRQKTHIDNLKKIDKMEKG